MTEWDDYRIILALARTGTLRSSAVELGLTHTTVSRRLSEIERSRGRLFDKHSRGYQPTLLGSALVDVAESMEKLTLAGARYQRALDEGLEGLVTLSLPEAIAQYLLLGDLLAFAELYPAIELRVETSYRFVDLDRSEADVVLRGANEPPEHLVGRRLFHNHVAFYADRDYLANTPKEQLRWIAPTPEARSANWLEDSPFPDAPVALAIDDITARHRALVQGLGMSRGACFMADPEPNLVRLSDDAPVPQQELWVLTHPDLRDTPRIKVVTDFIYRTMKAKEPLVIGQRP
ncbi:hypothetical protein BPTFM16_01479 [Altererythrobacter insulae]|nr:hypothetical protein BPTFM16_01479 [Altererythrobacter insulae]